MPSPCPPRKQSSGALCPHSLLAPAIKKTEYKHSVLNSCAGETFGSPFRHFSDEKCSRARPRGTRLCLWQNSYIAPAFSSPTQAKQFACSCNKKKPSIMLGLNFLRRGGLEPPSQRHAPLKRTRIPIPPPARLLKLCIYYIINFTVL